MRLRLGLVEQAAASELDLPLPPRAAFTPQVPRLFSETLRANLLLGRTADEEAMRIAVEAAVLDQDLSTLDAGLDTLVERQGVKLSGGQVQRTAAARMFLRDAGTIVAIAATAGYADQAHMTREFKELAGMAPGQLRASAVEATFVQDGRAPRL